MRFAQNILAFMVTGKKFGVILIGLPLEVTCPFSLTAFNILSFSSAFFKGFICFLCKFVFLYFFR